MQRKEKSTLKYLHGFEKDYEKKRNSGIPDPLEFNLFVKLLKDKLEKKD